MDKIDTEKDEIRRLEKELEYFSTLIKNHRNDMVQKKMLPKSDRNPVTSFTGYPSTKESRYRWAAGGTRVVRHPGNNYKSKSFDAGYNSANGNSPLQTTVNAGQTSQAVYRDTLAAKTSTDCHSLGNAYKNVGQLPPHNSVASLKITSGCSDKKFISCDSGTATVRCLPTVGATTATMIKNQENRTDSFSSAVSKGSTIPSTFGKKFVKQNSELRLSLLDFARVNKQEKPLSLCKPHMVLLGNDNCSSHSAKTNDASMKNICSKSSDQSNRFCAVNKYKIIRENNNNNLKQVTMCVPQRAHVTRLHNNSYGNKYPISTDSLSSSAKMLRKSATADPIVIHQSKYRLVKTDHESLKLNCRPEVGSLKAQSQLFAITDGKQSQRRCSSSNSSRRLSSDLGSFSSASKTRIMKCVAPNSTPIAFVSRYKLVKKAVQMSHGKQQHTKKPNKPHSRNSKGQPKERVSRSTHACLSWKHSSRTQLQRSRTGWITQFSLKREAGEDRENENCINAILGRKVSNLSSNKYKFINARPAVSNETPPDCNRKRKMLKVDRRTRAQVIRSPWNTRHSLMNSGNIRRSFSGHLRFSHMKMKSPFHARKWSHADLQRSLKGKTFSALKPAKDSSARYCLYYNRFGRCNRGDLCQYIHDPDKISVCTRFLRGTCKVTDCPFSHKIAKHKMPMCRFFLRRACNREDCPYSHVNVGKNAEVCLDFLRGFCINGDLCKKKHMLVCSDFSEKGTCPRGSDCPMQHLKKRKAKQVHLNEAGTVSKKSKRDLSASDVATRLDDSTDTGISTETSLFTDGDDVNLAWKKRRLPSFIALNTSVEDSLVSSTPETSVNSSGQLKSLIIHPRLKTNDAQFKLIESIIQQSSQEL